jgi:hypothetical protein
VSHQDETIEALLQQQQAATTPYGGTSFFTIPQSKMDVERF